MIRDVGESVSNKIFENLGRAAGRVQEKKPLPADLLESDDAYLVVFDAPGATASDLQVRYVEDRVEVRVDRFRDFHEGFEMRYPGRGLALDGSVTLPADAAVDAAEASATLKDNGTLQVRIPKVAGTDAGEEIDVESTVGDAADADEPDAETEEYDVSDYDAETDDFEERDPDADDTER
ncbi:Hsp20 family protein [Halomicroarcula limicola]|uniref:Hsp20 family protein n=1 Tax=Haloarcula limicola TaxID=1429915 RepID=A0A8J8C7L7_9EURY|nr:Hsp20 family protein [Halomicroarcula limicola]MBV0923680.1 Hsp20 family protein [Halomicroarcula limicola]